MGINHEGWKLFSYWHRNGVNTAVCATIKCLVGSQLLQVPKLLLRRLQQQLHCVFPALHCLPGLLFVVIVCDIVICCMAFCLISYNIIVCIVDVYCLLIYLLPCFCCLLWQLLGFKGYFAQFFIALATRTFCIHHFVLDEEIS